VTAERMFRNPFRVRRLNREGFTLIEVLAAMIILAVGLLALESMAIGAARRIAAANRHTEFTHEAGRDIERVLDAVRQAAVAPDPNSLSSQRTLENGAHVQTVVGQQVLTADRRLYTVTVTVTPPENWHLKLHPVTVTSRAIR
jgi:prepilin-type N-terminal cleavage/methylation domain-containing protein